MRLNFFVIIAAVCLLGACTAETKQDDKLLNAAELVNNPKNPDGTISADTSELPFLHLDSSPTYDFGKVAEGEKVQALFKFTNTGKSPLIISNVETSCGCTVSEYSKEAIAPGKQGWIKATYDSYGRPGSFQKTITVHANTFPNTTKLLIIGDVTPAN